MKPKSPVPVLMVFFSLTLCSGGALAEVVATDDLATRQMAVRELMRLDTAQALARARQAHRKSDVAAAHHDADVQLARSGPLRLVAIYGVGKNLLAQVKEGSRVHLYRRGRALPVGVTADAAVFRLRGISGSCVQLERKAESHTLCLHPDMWASR